MYTKEQMEALKEAVEHFDTIRIAKYKKNTPRALDEKVADIYEAATNTSVNRHWTCAKCVYTIYQLAGDLYYQSLDYYNRIKGEKEMKKNGKK